jgi:hypothetical protein
MTDSMYRGSVLEAKRQQIATFKKQVIEDQKKWTTTTIR